jgi:hypothetical protein
MRYIYVVRLEVGIPVCLTRLQFLLGCGKGDSRVLGNLCPQEERGVVSALFL